MYFPSLKGPVERKSRQLEAALELHLESESSNLNLGQEGDFIHTAFKAEGNALSLDMSSVASNHCLPMKLTWLPTFSGPGAGLDFKASDHGHHCLWPLLDLLSLKES